MEDAKIREVIKTLENIGVITVVANGGLLTADLQESIDMLRAELPKKVWEPTKGDRGFVVNRSGEVFKCVGYSLTEVFKFYVQGNLFETYELAEAEVKRRAATHSGIME